MADLVVVTEFRDPIFPGLKSVSSTVHLPSCRLVDMVNDLQTTLNIDDRVMQRLREEAARQGRTMSELVEAGLRRVLEQPPEHADEQPSPLPVWHSGGAQVDVANREVLYALMDAKS